MKDKRGTNPHARQSWMGLFRVMEAAGGVGGGPRRRKARKL